MGETFEQAMSGAVNRPVELDWKLFDQVAQNVMRLASEAAKRTGEGLLDSRLLLQALASEPTAELWPESMAADRVALVEGTAAWGPSTERRGRLVVGEAGLSEEVQATLTEAITRAQMRDRAGEITPADMLLALADTHGSDAASWLRSVRGVGEPWDDLRRHVERLPADGTHTDADGTWRPVGDRPVELGSRGVTYERMVALVYTLARDEVPFGALTEIVGRLEAQQDFRFLNSHAESLARSLVDRLWS